MWRSLWKWISGWMRGGPHFVVGPASDPYLHRWYILPRNPFCNIYLHRFMRDDDDRALHTHPWPSMSLLVKGRYIEETPYPTCLRIGACFGEPITDGFCAMCGWNSTVRREYGWLSLVFRRANHAHRIELPGGRSAWTLFVTGPKVREWDFLCRKGRVPWREFVAPHNIGETGKGCGEMD